MNTMCRISQCGFKEFRRFHKCAVRSTAAETAALQNAAPEKPIPPRISKIADDIVGLNLLEVAALSDLLKKRLNLPDTPVMSFGTAPAVAKPEEEEEQAAPQAVQSTFTVKLVTFDAAKKIDVIKALKNILPNCNLVQAKKFVENLPGTIKEDVRKEEAVELEKALQAIGCEVKIE